MIAIDPTTVEPNITTRDGALVMLFAYMSEQSRPYLGIYHNKEEWVPCSWNKDGTYIDNKHTTGLDLLIVASAITDKEAA